LAHGDISPANIILSGSGPVLIDWAEDCAGTPGWRVDATTPHERDAFALQRLRSLVGD
jgi:RIO-like serine/threonine protein kinase